MKYLFVSIFITFCLLSTKNVHAADFQLQKYEQNPISVVLENGLNNESHLFHPFVMYEDNQWKLWYTTRNENSILMIAYATSDNGTTWQRKALISFPQFEGIHNPTILKKGNVYYLYFIAYQNKQVYGGVYRATSQDGIHFDEQSVVSVYQTQQQWEHGEVTSPFVYFEDGTYYLWYAGNNFSVWSAGLAISSDGIHFTPCSTNPRGAYADGPFIITYKQKKYFFYHYIFTIGIEYLPLPDIVNCNTQLESNNGTPVIPPNMPYDADHITNPSPVIVNDSLYIYYNGLGDKGWVFAAASTDPFPTLSPTPTPKIPVVFIPGMFASWNKDAIVYKKDAPIPQWKLLPFAKEMDGIIKTFHNIGYQDGKDLFIVYYDWRKPVAQTVDQLRDYLQSNIFSKNPSQKILLIGHSLGGIVSRVYSQKYGTEHIERLVTIASPHQGTALVYKPLEGGEIDGPRDLRWLGSHLILQLYKDGIQSNKDIINTYMPSLRDIAPIQPFLTHSQKGIIDPMNTHIPNTLLLQYSDMSAIRSLLTTIIGNQTETIGGYTVDDPSFIQKTLNLYQDGAPNSVLLAQGDGTITAFSAQEGNMIALPYSHTELIYKKQAIQRLLETLHISFSDSDIVEGQKTNMTNAYVLLVQSPILLQATGNNEVYSEKDGLIYIENPGVSPYTLTATGIENGSYTITIGKIKDEEISWNEIKGTITANPPSSQQDVYTLPYAEPTLPLSPIPLSPSPKPTLITFLSHSPTPIPEQPTPTMTPTSAPSPIPTPTITPVIQPTRVPEETETVLGIQEETPFPVPTLFISIQVENNGQIHPSVKIVSGITVILISLIFIIKRLSRLSRFQSVKKKYEALSSLFL